MATFQQIMNSARTDLLDTDIVRYSEADLLEYANDGVKEAFRIRPDFRLGSYTTAFTTYIASDTVPIPELYQMLLKHYIVFRAELRDTEYVDEGRATAFLARFERGMLK